MSLRGLFNADAGLTVLLHVLKALVALLLNWIVLRQFAVEDFVVWSVTSSILIVATASDLGIGQYAITQLINADRRGWPAHVGQSLGALIPLALLSGLFVFFAVDGPSELYRATMALLLAGRILTIPFVAVLHAVNQFKIRKAIELGAYVVAAVLVGGIALSTADIYLALITLNVTFFLAHSLMAVAGTRYVSPRASLRAISPLRSARIFRAAVPFMVNNITGLLAYGGFIWLSSLILPPDQVAKLAILHSFVLVNLYQIYDVFLKARQADLGNPIRVEPYRKLNLLIMLTLPPAFLLAGRQALALLSGSRVEISMLEAALYGLLVALELGNLFVQSITQVNLALVHRLKSYSAMRAAMIGAFLLAGLVPMTGDQAILVLLGVLLTGSMITFAYLSRGAHGPTSEAEPTAARRGEANHSSQ